VKKSRTKPVFLVLLLFLTLANLYGQGIEFKETSLRENILETAEHYVTESDWKKAIMTYYNFIYRFPEDSLVVPIHYQIAHLYELGGQLVLAEQHLNETIEIFQNTGYDLENRQRLALFLYQHQRWEESLRYAYYQTEPPFKIIVAYNLIQMGELDLADSVLMDFHRQTGQIVPLSSALPDLILKSAKLPGSQKAGAFILSTVLPGSGRFLYKEYLGGTIQLTAFGGLAGATAYTVLHQSNWLLLTGPLTGACYLVNLYITQQAGKRYLLHIKQEGIARIISDYPLETALGLRATN